MMTEHDLSRSGPARLTSIDRSPVRLALFAGGLVLALVAGFGVGQLFGSSGDAAGTTGPMGQAGTPTAIRAAVTTTRAPRPRAAWAAWR
jgi:hypothetical protein